MNQTDKDTIQDQLINLEQTIRAYKQEYPSRFADMFHTNAYYLMWLSAIAFLMVRHINPEVQHYCVIVATICSLYGSIEFIRKKKRIQVQATSIRKQVDKALQPLESLGKDSNIKNYLSQCNKAIRAIDNEKYTIKKRFHTFVTIYCVVVGMLVALIVIPNSIYQSLYNRFFVPDKYKKVKLFNEKKDGIYLDNLHISTYEPFITLKPLTNVINDSINLQLNELDFYISEIANSITTRTPLIEGFKEKRFRITITDIKGNPVKHAPYIDFLNSSIITEHSHPITRNDYEALRLLHYLQDNQNQLRYMLQLKE